MLDAVDTILRHFRQQPLILSAGAGPVYRRPVQLPPVVSAKNGPCWSNIIKALSFLTPSPSPGASIYLELEKIIVRARRPHQYPEQYPQQPRDIRTSGGCTIITVRSHPSERENYITLTSHNARAQHQPAGAVQASRQAHSFEAAVTGEFQSGPPAKEHCAERRRQIMLIKNDKERPGDSSTERSAPLKRSGEIRPQG